MLWKAYSCLFLLYGLYATWLCVASGVLLPNPVTGFVVTDLLVSYCAQYCLFRFAFGLKPKSLLVWKILAFTYIAIDLHYNLAVMRIEMPTTLVGLAISLPSYIAVSMYGLGKIAGHKSVRVVIDHDLPEKLAALEKTEEEKWHTLEKEFEQLQARGEAKKDSPQDPGQKISLQQRTEST
jgi:hypothetical protein